MKTKVFFISGLIGMFILLTSFVVSRTSSVEAVNASKVELNFEDGTTAMGIPITTFLDDKGRLCATVDATGKTLRWKKMLKLQDDWAVSCHCNSCGCGFSSRLAMGGGCCVTCICCGAQLDKLFCQPSACAVCCCRAYIIDDQPAP